MKKSPDQIIRRYFRRELHGVGIRGITLLLGAEGSLCTFWAARLNFTICARRFWREIEKSLTTLVNRVN